MKITRHPFRPHFKSNRFFVLAILLSLAPAVSAQNTDNYSTPSLLKQSVRSFSGPTDLAISPDGAYLLVADTGNNEIKVLQPGTLKLISQFGRAFLDAPQIVEFDLKKSVWVTDKANKRITKYRFEGVHRDGSSIVEQLGSRSISPVSEKAPNSAVDGSGVRYVAMPGKNRIDIFDKENNPVGFYGSADNAEGTGPLNAPEGVETVGRYFWVSDTGNNRILLIKAPRPTASRQ